MFTVAGEILVPFAAVSRLSRRDCGRARRIVAQQRRFTQPTSKRFRPLLFMHGDDFPEALDLFRLRSAAWGQGWEVYEAWVTRYQRAQSVRPEELERTRKKRRPRNRRRGRKAPRSEDSEDAPENPV
jgi:hypothetical protein